MARKLFCVVLFLLICVSSYAGRQKKIFKVGLAVLKDNPDYHVAKTAFVNFLDSQKAFSVRFIPLDSYGDMDSYKKGLKRLVEEEKIDLLFTTGTRSTLPAIEIIKDIPIVFTAVAAPVRSGIVKSLKKPGGNVTGTHCSIPVVAQLKSIEKVLPYARNLGIVYTKGEVNAEIQVDDFKKASKSMGLNVITSHVSKDCKSEKEVFDASQKLVGKIDVFIALLDTSLSRYGKGMLVVAEQNKIPSYSPLGHLLTLGSTFSLGADFHMLGELAARKALSILVDGTNAGDISVGGYEKYSLKVNLSCAKKIGVSIPVSVLRSASKVIK